MPMKSPLSTKAKTLNPPPMSTRANIILRDAEGNRLCVYHHYDGYLHGVGRKLERILHSIPSATVPDPVGEQAESTPSHLRASVSKASALGIPNTLQGLADYLHAQDELFEPNIEVGDPEYIYEINLSTRKVEWFHVNCCSGDILDQGFLCEY